MQRDISETISEKVGDEDVQRQEESVENMFLFGLKGNHAFFQEEDLR